MSLAAAFVDQLRFRGIKVWLDSGKVRYRAPPGVIEPADLQMLRRNKSEIIELLDVSQEKSTREPPRLTAFSRAGEGDLPLSFAQERLWFLQQLGGVGSAYNIPAALQLDGELDVAGLSWALSEIVSRHEVLRTQFVERNGRAVQVIDAPWQIELQPESVSEEELTVQVQAESGRSFNLSQDRLLRVRLLKRSESQHVLIVVMHHIVSDGWSMEILTREVSELYGSRVQGRAARLPTLKVQYADYAQWQRQWLQGEVLESQLSYWTQQLSGAPAMLQLPTDRPRPTVASFRGDSVQFTLPALMVQALVACGRDEGASLFMVLMAAYQVLLGRLSSQDDIVVGTPIANRTRSESEGLIGFFVNALALRTSLAGEPSFRQLLGRVRDTALGAYAHQDLPFEHVVKALSPTRDLGRQPITQVAMSLQNASNELVRLPGLNVEPLPQGSGSAKYDLTLTWVPNGEGLSGHLEYATDLFDRKTIERMAGHLRTLLGGIAADPDCATNRLPVLSERERLQLLVDWNATATPFAQDKCLHELFDEQAARTPEATAILFEGRQLSYAQLQQRSNQLAHYLKARGVGPEKIVGLCLERSLEMVIGLLGILKSGGAYLPLDPGSPKNRLDFMLEDAGVSLVLSEASDWVEIAKQPTHAVLNTATPENLAYVIYTSGSTGTPKGVSCAHRNLVNAAESLKRNIAIEADWRVLQFAPLTFDASIGEISFALTSGAALVLAKQQCLMPGQELARVMNEQRVNVACLPPVALPLLDPYSFPNLETVVVAGDACSTETAAAWASRCRFMNIYGPTETTISATWSQYAGQDRLTIGRPNANTQLFVLDSNMEVVPVGCDGELYIGGVGVSRGYLGRAGLTAQRFVANPFGDCGSRLYRTGDLVRYRADGNLEFLGRIDNQVKIRGFRIELGEIESRLLACAGVREAVVIAREDKPGDKRLVAYLTAHGNHTELSAAELRSQLSAALPHYMVPGAYVVLERLPTTANGKLDRKALPAPADDSLVAQRYVAPEGELEMALARIWQEVLKVDRVGRQDNFFELGGHSLLVVKLMSRVRQELNVDIPLREVFSQPTVAGLARAVAVANRSVQTVIEPVDRNGRLPLSFAQQRLWFLDRLDHAASAAYHIAGGVRLQGLLNRAALRQALDRIIDRHEGLRTTFASVDAEPVQLITPSGVGFSLSEQDLQGATDRQVTLHQLSRIETAQPFDLQRGPLIRGRLLQLDEQEHVLLITMHHIVADGWSFGVLVQELSASYGAFCQGLADPLPPLPIQYVEYAAWQRKWLQGEERNRQVEYWKQHLGGAPALLELPTDRPRPPVRSHAGGSVDLALGSGLTSDLSQLAQRHGITLFMTLLAGWSVLLSRLSGQSEVVIGTPVANRQRGEIEGLVGFFVNTLAIRVRMEDSPTVGQLLAQIKSSTLEAFAHQDIPFDQVVEALQPARSLGHTPVFQAMLALNNTPQYTELHLPGLTLSRVDQTQATAQFDVMLSMCEASGGIVGKLEYSSDLFERATIERMAAQLQLLLERMVADTGQSITRLPMLTEQERHQLLVEWNPPATQYPQDKRIHELFEAQVARTPDAVAITYQQQQLSYAQLNAQANQLAHYLREQGVKPESLVGLCVERSTDMLVGLLGILKAGGAYVPLDPDYPAERLAYMVADSAPAIVLTDTATRGTVAAVAKASRIVDLQADAALWSHGGTQSPPAHVEGSGPQSLAYVIYTSGSTGSPKGVMVEHASVLRLFDATAEQFAFCNRDVWTLFHSFAFDFSVWEIWGALLYGGRLAIVPHWVARAPKAFAEFLLENQVTVLNQTPSAFRQLIAAQEDLDMSGHCLRVVIFGGEALDLAPLKTWVARHGAHRPQLVNMYGITEITVHATYRALGEAHVASERGSVIGVPLSDMKIHLLDSHANPVPIGVAGELYVGGPGLARGYLNRPELTAERFIRDPYSTSTMARLYKTGDLGRYRADGSLEYLGRNDHQVKIRGFRIELGEIESQLLACPGVREAVVIARQSEAGDKQLVAYVRPQGDNAEISPAELRTQLAAMLPQYMVPGAYVVLNEFPLTTNGKLDRKALPAPAEGSRVLRQYVAPDGEVELAIAQIWQQLLKVERVGRQDNFFELGGHSLLAVQLVESLRATNLFATVRSVFEHPTLSGMAAFVGSQRATESVIPPNLIVPGSDFITPEMLSLIDLDADQIRHIVQTIPGGARNIQDIYPLVPLQAGMLFHHMLDQDADTYVIPVLLAIESEQALQKLLRTLQVVIDRHDILRTAILWEDLAQPVQVVCREATLPVKEIALDPRRDAVEQLRALMRPQHLRMDLNVAPLLRAIVARDPHSRECYLMLQVHHIIDDATSMNLILAEMAAQRAGAAQLLPEPVAYRDYVAQLLVRSDSAAYFEDKLGDLREPAMPFGLREVYGTGDETSEVRQLVGPDLAQSVRQHARDLGVSPAAMFHAAWATVVALTSDRDDVVFGSVVSGRLNDVTGADRALGMFINTLPLRLRLQGRSADELIRQTQLDLTEVISHSHISLVEAQRCSGLGSGVPLFTALLNYRHGGSSAMTPDRRPDLPSDVRVLAAREWTNYPCVLHVDDLPGGDFGLTAQMDRSVDPAVVNECLVNSLRTLVDALQTKNAVPVLQLAATWSRHLPRPDAMDPIPAAPAECVAPQGDTEIDVARVWCHVLDCESVGRNQGFFESGGDSLRLVKLQAGLRELGLNLPLRALLTSTVASAAQLFSNDAAISSRSGSNQR